MYVCMCVYRTRHGRRCLRARIVKSWYTSIGLVIKKAKAPIEGCACTYMSHHMNAHSGSRMGTYTVKEAMHYIVENFVSKKIVSEPSSGSAVRKKNL